MWPAILRRCACLAFLVAFTFLLAFVPLALTPGVTRAQEAAAEVDEELDRERQVVERFVTVLERSPRRGTALDRIYGHHIESGTLDEFVKKWTDRTTQNPKDGVAWMILGLVESQRGRDAAAVEAFRQATELRPDDPLAAYYLGQSQILVGQPDEAVKAFELALARKPVQADLLAIFQALGRVHQQAQRVDEALAVWTRLEKLFPNDPRVQEDIATTLVEEGQFADALVRYESLAKQTTDDYRKTMYRIQAADLKIKTNRSADGIADLESLIRTLNPQNWLFREVRHQIEEVFLRTSDDDGLAKYYEKWLETNPEDVDAMGRVGRVLARQGRIPEAQQWLDKALKLAPSRKELRLAFIDQLVDEQRYEAAIAQYAELDKADPNNPDYLRNWGKLVLRDTARPKPERQAEAEKIWRRMMVARPTDPLIAAQVADLFRYAEMPQQSLELYQKAVELAPGEPQYREYLGEFYHILKRPEEAQATWRKLAEGPLRTAGNVARLAEVLVQFGYLQEALPEIAEACRLDPKDFTLQLKAAEMQLRGEQLPAALESLTRAGALAQNDEEREAVLVQQIKVYALDESLTQRIATLEAETAAGKATAEQWFLLARYQEERRAFAEATAAIRKATELAPNSIPYLASSARISEAAGELEPAANEHRKLATLDRRGRTDHLRHVAELESQLGRVEQALAAGRDLIAAAPGNVDTHQFFADLCFRLGQSDEALKTLRRAVRANPNDENILLTLASALATQFRTEEAIELYWQAFEKSTELDDKLSTVGKLTDLYLQTNHFDQLLERLERMRQEAESRRELTICVAQAHQSAGDFGTARQELERLLSENSRDTQLLQQLSKLAESESDLTSAVTFQEQVAQVAPGPEAEYRLATLLSRAGRSQEAAELLVRLTAKEEDPEKLLRNIDGLLTAQEFETALNAVEPKVRENPKDWELLYRQGVALFSLRPQEATATFRAILALDLSDDEPSTAVKNREKAKQQRANATAQQNTELPFLRIERVYEVQRVVGINADYYSMSQRSTNWSPPRFAQARMAALGWLYRLSQANGKSEELLTEFRTAAEPENAPARALWDWVYLEAIRGANQQSLLPIARRLAKLDDLAGYYLYLMQIANRNSQVLQAGRRGGEVKDTLPPLAEEDLALFKRAFAAVERAMSGANMPNMNYIHVYIGQSLIAEYKRANRPDDAKQMYQETIGRANTELELVGVMSLAIAESDMPGLSSTFDRFVTRDLQSLGKKSTASASAANNRPAAAQILGGAMLKPTTERGVARDLYDRYLTYQAATSNLRRKDSRSRSTTRTSRSNNQLAVPTSGANYRTIQITYPTANAFFDNADIVLCRSMYERFKQDDLLSDLITHLEGRVQAVQAGEKIYPALALAYMHAWNEDSGAAIKAMLAATEFEPSDAQLRLDLARLCLQSQQLEEALAQLDALTPADQNALRDRELLALDVGVRLGELERSRQAAQRLFGLRLDAETQIELAGKMRRLGMMTEAEAIMARAQRQAGSSLATLAALLGQHLADGKAELATEVAHQILRRSRPMPTAQAVMGYNTADSGYRNVALQCLAQSGNLKDVIARLEKQLERSPKSTPLAETLTEYYAAAGDKDKSLELQGKIVELQPNDADLRFRYAQVLQNSNKADQACDQYKLALKAKPALLQNRAYDVMRAFQQAKRQVELAKFVGELDIKGLTNPYGVIDLVRNMLQNREQRDAGMALLRKAWEAYPAHRSQLLQSFYDDEIWKTPEVFEFGRQSLLPTPEGIRTSPWSGLDTITSYSQDGHANSVLEKVLKAAAGKQQLEKLRDDVAAHAEKHTDWSAGKLLVAIMDLRLKRAVDIREAIKPLVNSSANDYRQMQVAWIVGQEIEALPEMRDVVITLYKSAVDNPQFANQQFQYSAGPRLVKAYLANQQRDEARKLLVNAARNQTFENYDPAYASYMRVETMQNVGKQLQEADFPVDALRIYRNLLTDNTIDASRLSQYGRDLPTIRKEAQTRMDAIMARLSGEAGAAAVVELLAPRENAGETDSAIDLLMTTTLVGSDLPKIDSLVAKFIESANLGSDARQSLRQKFDELAAARPKDFSIAVVQGLLTAGSNDATQTQAVLERVAQLMEDVPLDELPPGVRPNARQREEAQRQVSLWLLAKACLSLEPAREMGLKFANRAVEAAGRQTDPALSAAMLHERGMMSLQAGKTEDAKRDWNELIELSIIKPRLLVVRKASEEGPPQNTARAAKAPQAADGSTPKGPAKSLPVTLSQFKLGSGLALLAAKKDMPELSLRAIREVVSGGLPVTDVVPVAGAQRMTMAVRVNAAAATMRSDVDLQIYQELATRMWQVSTAWEMKQLPAGDVCDLLEDLVFPANRPDEVLLFEQPLDSNWSAPKSVGCLLALWAQKAGRTAEIEKQVAARASSPLNVLNGHILLTQMHLAGKDYDRVRSELQAIDKLVVAGRLGNWASTAAHAIGPAFDEPQLTAAAAPLMTKAVAQINTLASGYNSPPDDSPLTTLVRHYLHAGDVPAAKGVVDGYLTRRQAEYARYGGDSPLSMQRMDYTWAANELCRANDFQTTLDALAKVADSPALSRSSQLSLTRSLHYLARQAKAIPAAERYEKLLAWMAPTAQRKTLRTLVIIDGGQPVPNAFLQEDDMRFDPRPKFAPISNLTLLVDAAGEVGKLDELWELSEKLNAEKVAGADALGLLVAIARNDVKTVEKRVAQKVSNYLRDLALNRAQASNDWTPIVISYAAISKPETAAAGEKILSLLVEASQNDRTTLRSWLSYGTTQHEMGATESPAPVPLRHWVVADNARATSTAGPPAVWTAADGHIKRLCGGELDETFFRYPLTGNFELTAEARIGAVDVTNFTYGGLGYLPGTNEALTIQTLAGNDAVRSGQARSRPAAATPLGVTTPSAQWHRVRLQVVDGKTRFEINGWPAFEDRSPSTSSPWFGIFGLGNRQATVRNMAIHGTPTIPRTVRLIDGNRMEGWAPGLGSTMQPSASLQAAVGENRAISALSESRQAQNLDATYDWTAADGVLRGRMNNGQLTGGKAWLSYHRPLLDKETLRYQFHYRPGELQVHPTIGRIAYLLEPGGLRLQWLQPATLSGALVSLSRDAIIEEPTSRRTAVADALKENDWNDVELSLAGDLLSIRLNGQVICERPQEVASESFVGFFYLPGQTAAEIRNVELSGPWPETLGPEVLADLLAPADDNLPRETRQAAARLVGEPLIGDNAGAVWESVADLAPEARYEKLLAWVLPGNSHASFRVQSGLTTAGVRVQPALELVRLAEEQNKLNALATAIQEAGAAHPADKYSLGALEAVVAIHRKDAATANARLGKLASQLSQHAQELRGQWPHAELLAAEAALADPLAKEAGLTLADRMATLANNRQLNRTDWQRLASAMVDRANNAAGATGAAPWPLAQWKPVDHESGSDRVFGQPASAWHVAADQVRYFASGEQSGLYFAVPLRGDFEVRFEQQRSRQRGLALQYSGWSTNLNGDGRDLRRHRIGLPESFTKLEGKAPKDLDWNEYRLVAQGEKLSVLINGVEVASEKLPADRDPWLALVTSPFNRLGTIRRVQVSGQPTIPNEIVLSGSAELSGWNADYFDKSFSPDGMAPQAEATVLPHWTRQGEEIVGAREPNAQGSFRESLLQYHRPLLEDGELEYEFYWETDKAAVHPAIGNIALLLSPEGVQTHQLTRGALDRSGLASDNRTPLAGSQPVQLQNDAWNRALLTLKGNTLTIAVGGQQVAQLELAANEPRTFGLFHYQDASTARVRNVIHRGNWPKQLPAVEQQELAVPASTAAAQASGS